MTSMHLFGKGDKIWVKEPQGSPAMDPQDASAGRSWKLYTISGQGNNNRLIIESHDGDRRLVSPADLENVAHPAWYRGEDNIINYTEYPQVVSNLAGRYLNAKFYTYAGTALLALNPMRRVPLLYTPEVSEAYKSAPTVTSLTADLDPHIFSLAEEAYRTLKMTETNQSIIVSGESGAGKTVSAKYLLMYLMGPSTSSAASLAMPSEGAYQPNTCSKDLHDKILHANPILEAFGNATTLRNANSSRFGKYLNLIFKRPEVGLSESHRLDVSGCFIETYLLEKSRVVSHHAGERTYHVFYYLLSGCTPEEKSKWKLGSKQDHRITTPLEDRSNYVPARKASVAIPQLHLDPYLSNHPLSPQQQHREEAEMLIQLRIQFEKSGISSATQQIIFKILAGLLHLGDVSYACSTTASSTLDLASSAASVFGGSRFGGSSSSQGQCSIKNLDTLALAADFLGIDHEILLRSLTKKSITTRGETILSPLTRQDAETTRDALIKTIYEELFLWMVSHFNKTTGPYTNSINNSNNTLNGPNATKYEQHEQFRATLGILDIYGFENFKTNSLEQLCINYANEKLQQQFVGIIFKKKQELYDMENIAWSFIKFADNSLCLELIEGKMGVLNLLDEQCSLKRQIDPKTYTQRLYSSHPAECSKYFIGNKAGSDTCQFTICHYATNVTYDTTFFLAKNLDKTSEAHLDLLSQSKSDFVRKLFMTEARQRAAYKTVVSAFKTSLEKLVHKLNASSPYYIKCIKPTPRQAGSLLRKKDQQEYDDDFVVDQLRAAGILDVVRISQAGYAYQIRYHDFLKTFHPLIATSSSSITRAASVVTAEDISKTVISYLYQQHIQSSNSSSHHHSQPDATQSISQFGSLKSADTKAYEQLHAKHADLSIMDVQYGETMIFMRYAFNSFLEDLCLLLQNKAAVRITSAIKGFAQRKFYLEKISAAKLIQQHVRRHQAHTYYVSLRSCAVSIQAAFRGKIAKREYNRMIHGFYALQNQIRAFLARQRYLKQRRLAIMLQAVTRMYFQRDTILIMKQQLEQERAARQLVNLIASLGGDIKIEFPSSSSSAAAGLATNESSLDLNAIDLSSNQERRLYSPRLTGNATVVFGNTSHRTKMKSIKLLKSFSHSYEHERLILSADKLVTKTDLKAVRIHLENAQLAHPDNLKDLLVFINDTQIHPIKNISLQSTNILKDLFLYNYCDTASTGILHRASVDYQELILQRGFITRDFADEQFAKREMAQIQESVLLGIDMDNSFSRERPVSYDIRTFGLPDLLL